jgi:multiple sugar transport system permease protein
MRRNIEKAHIFWAFVMISPWLLRFIFLTVGPMLMSLFYSFTDYPILSAPRWIGIKNYVKMVSDDRLFWLSLTNTLFYTGFSIPLTISAAFFLALLLNQKIKGVGIYRTLIYLPVMIPVVANATLWKWIFNSEAGLSAIVFNLVGLESPMWFRDPAYAKPALILMNLWYLGQPMAIFLAGLQGIPSQLYEAASIDGAKPVRTFFSITLPIMTPVLLFNIVIGIINSFQVFVPAFVITGGGPLNSTTFFMLHLYEQGFSFFKMGYASALSWVLFSIILVLTLVIFRSSKTWVFYQTR